MDSGALLGRESLSQRYLLIGQAPLFIAIKFWGTAKDCFMAGIHMQQSFVQCRNALQACVSYANVTSLTDLTANILHNRHDLSMNADQFFWQCKA